MGDGALRLELRYCAFGEIRVEARHVDRGEAHQPFEFPVVQLAVSGMASRVRSVTIRWLP